MERSGWQKHADRLLVFFDLAKSHGSWSEAILSFFFDSSFCGCSFLVGSSRFGSNLRDLLRLWLESGRLGVGSLGGVDLLSGGLLLGHFVCL